MRRGFTLIELLVASLLLGLLVSILTTIFSQSSIAWSTGTAGVVDLDRTRREMAVLQTSSEAILGRNGLSAQSVFQGMSGNLNTRGYVEGAQVGSVDISNPTTWSNISISGAGSSSEQGVIGRGKAYVVGITSAGPDGKFNTWDDITTWPMDE